MRVATYAKSIGRTVPFAQAAFRQAFAGGRTSPTPDYVVIAAAACEMHPEAVLRGRGCARWPRSWQRSAAAPAAGVTRGSGGARGARSVVRRRGALARAAEHLLGSHGRRPRMRARRAYRLIVTRGGRAPALLADAGRSDHIEVVEHRQRRGGPLLGPPAAGGVAARARLRDDLGQLEAEEFMARWSTVEH